MTDKDLQILKDNINKLVRIVCVDGEELIAKIVTVSEDEGDIIYELVSTNRESNYEKFDAKPGGYLTPFKEIKYVESVQHL
jgi:hypothetical protein